MLRIPFAVAMDIWTLNFNLEKLQVNQSTRGCQQLEYVNHTPKMEYSSTGTAEAYIGNGKLQSVQAYTMTEKLATMTQEAKEFNCGFHSVITDDLLSSSRPGLGISLPRSQSAASLPFLHSSQNCNKMKSRTHATDNFCALESEYKDDHFCVELCLETLNQENHLVVLRNSDVVEHNSSEEEEEKEEEEKCHEINQDLNLRNQSRPNSSTDEEVSGLLDGLKPTTSAVLQGNNYHWLTDPGFKNLPISKQNFMSMKLKDSSAVNLRPNLDFNKMRKSCYGRRHCWNHIKKPKLVRIRGFRGHKVLESRFCPLSSAAYSFSQKLRLDEIMPLS